MLLLSTGLVGVDLCDKVEVVAGLQLLAETFFSRNDFLLSLDSPVEILMLHQLFVFDPFHVLLMTLDGQVHRLEHGLSIGAVGLLVAWSGVRRRCGQSTLLFSLSPMLVLSNCFEQIVFLEFGEYFLVSFD